MLGDGVADAVEVGVLVAGTAVDVGSNVGAAGASPLQPASKHAARMRMMREFIR